MSEPVQIALGLVLLACVFVLTRYLIAWKLKRAVGRIIGDLESQRAVDPVTAIDLPYTQQNPLRIGMRNYYAKAIEYMLAEGAVGKTGSGKYYLRLHGAAVPNDGPEDNEHIPAS